VSKFKLNLNGKILAILFFLGLLTLLSVSIILKTVGYDEILKIEERFLRQKGETVASVIGQNLASVERLVINMAKLGETLPKDPSVYHRIVPQLIGETDSQSYIAGGGIWPEPFTFNPNLERHSFFWGRNDVGKLEFFDNYNNPNGKGYNTEEWYVPGNYLAPGQIYWSRSYVDPYSFEPMVTATTPYFDNKGKFSGVTTVDVKLQGLNLLFAEHAKEIDGYIFALDRNDVFLSFPFGSDIRPYNVDESGNPVGQYSSIDSLAGKNTAFSKIAKLIHAKRDRLAGMAKSVADVPNLGQTLASRSYQISLPEAEQIIADITNRYQRTTQEMADDQSEIIIISHDAVLKKKAIATVHYLQQSQWFVVAVSPLEFTEATVNLTTQTIVMWIFIGMLVSITLAYVIFYRIINIPFRATINMLQKNIDSGNEQPLPEKGNDELSILTALFNKRTKMLDTARRVADEANKSKSEFLSRISHELRTPLNAILGFSQLLKLDKDMKLTHLDQLSEIESAGTHLLSLINDIIDISRIETGDVNIELVPLDVGEIINEVINLISPLVWQKQITIYKEPDSCNDIYVIGDRMALKQALTNLLSNAAKYNTKGGEISIICRAMDNVTAIDIIDTGEGIAEEKLKDIYEPFNRLGREYSGIEGTGIGLLITKQLVEAMNGKIIIKSVLGQGSTFSIVLPRCGGILNMERIENNRKSSSS